MFYNLHGVDDVELRVETLLPPEVGALADN